MNSTIKYEIDTENIKKKFLNEVSKSICTIKIGNDYFTGFFIKFELEEIHQKLFALITSYEAIPNIINQRNIEIQTIIGNNKENIKLNIKQRKIRTFKEQNITLIEIIDKDNLKEKINFLNCDLECKSEIYKKYLNTDIFILNIREGEELDYYNGKIIKINEPKESNFKTTLDIKVGVTDPPILLFEKSNGEPKVLGIHTSSTQEENNSFFETFIDFFLKLIFKTNDYLEQIDELIFNENSSLIIDEEVVLKVNNIQIGAGATLDVKGCLIFG